MKILPFQDDTGESSTATEPTEAAEQVQTATQALKTLEEENLAFRERLRMLEQRVVPRERPLHKEGLYWLRLSKVESDIGPYCRRCYDEADRLVRLDSSTIGRHDAWRCPTCWMSYRK